MMAAFLESVYKNTNTPAYHPQFLLSVKILFHSLGEYNVIFKKKKISY